MKGFLDTNRASRLQCVCLLVFHDLDSVFGKNKIAVFLRASPNMVPTLGDQVSLGLKLLILESALALTLTLADCVLMCLSWKAMVDVGALRLCGWE